MPSLPTILRKARCKMGRETIATIECGQYTSLDGEPISIAEDLERLRRDTVVISPGDDVSLPSLSPNPVQIPVEFMHCTTLEACQYHRESKIGALNFASAKNPGGGFINGSQAQEESVARSSTLYASLTTPTATTQYYHRHRKIKPNDGLYTSTIILSPEVLVFRDEHTGKTLESPLRVTILSCPAVNAGQTLNILGHDDTMEQLVRDNMKDRIERILAVFVRAQIETVILGAYGCGVFKNKVDDVARMFKAVLHEREWPFHRVAFAITDATMLKTFQNEFEDGI